MQSYEELLNEYNEIANKLEDENIKLQDAIKLYEKSNHIYIKLNKYLDESKQKIIDCRESNVWWQKN